VNEIAYSPDGTQIAVATSIGVWLYDAETYKETALLAKQEGYVDYAESVAFSLDGEMLAVGISAWDAAVHLWDAKTGEHLFALTGDFRTVASVAFSPDGKTLASEGGDTVWLWDVETGALLRVLHGHKWPVVSIAFSPDGAVIASAGGLRGEGELGLWDVNTGRNLWTRTAVANDLRFVAFNSDGQTLVSGGWDGAIRLWDAAAGQFLREVPDALRGAPAIAYSANRQILDVGGPGGEGLWGAAVKHPPVHYVSRRWFIGEAAFSPDGETLAVASDEGLVRIWDTESGEQIGMITGHGRPIRGAAFSPDSKLIAGFVGREMALWNADTGERSSKLSEIRSKASAAAFSPTGGLIALGGVGEVHLWDLNADAPVRTLIGLPNKVRWLAFSPDGSLIAGADTSRQPVVGLWNARTGRLLHLFHSPVGTITSLAFSWDGITLAIAIRYGSVRLFDVRTGELQRYWKEFDKEVVSAAFSRDRRTFAIATADELILWNAITWKRVRTIRFETNDEIGIDFNPTGEWIAGEVAFRTIRIWNTATGAPLRTITGHQSRITNVAFSPDGGTLASASWDGTILVWQLASPPSSSGATVSITPSPVPSPEAGSQLTFSLAITAGIDVAGYQATVSFDSSVLRFAEDAAGDYLPADASFVPTMVDENRVTLGATAFGAAGEGDGTLAKLTFEALADKTSSLILSEVTLVNSSGVRVYPAIVHAEVVGPPPVKGDVNWDGTVDILDLVLVAENLGSTGVNDADVNGDSVVNILDLVIVAGAIGGGGAAPSAQSLDPSIVSAADVERWLALAQSLDAGDPIIQHGIRFLEQLLEALMPHETALLPNYPNPFNPETWIPYHLAQKAVAAITIYDVKGGLVRQLRLGHQTPGHYVDRGRAAYWDGRNESGESVASGIYVYHLRAGDYAASRRMVIVK
ncbi:MAG: cohesin domain-containing protein, partial [Candidatus Poribacteria bacterium]|nr:cohesin domain-containing protein [Candidatus Poribacteria bacterium]